MKLKCIFSFVLAVILSTNLGLSVQAMYEVLGQGEPIEREVVMVEGIPVVFEVFDDDGTITEIARIEESMMRGNIDHRQLLNSIVDISDQRSEMIHSRFVENLYTPSWEEHESMEGRSARHWTEQHNNGAQGTGSSRDAFAGHWATGHYRAYDIAMFLNARNGASRALWGGSGNATAFEIVETITRSGVQVSVSFPLGFSVNGSRSAATRSSRINQPGMMATLHRPDFSANTPITLGRLITIQTEGRSQVGGSVFVAQVTSRW